MNKRILSLILAVIICVGVIPFSTSAYVTDPDRWVKEGDWYFDTSNGDAAVTAYVGKETNIVVPSSYKGRDVTYFNSDLLAKCPNKDKVTQIYFPSTIRGYFEYRDLEDGDGYYYTHGFKLADYASLKKIKISDANPVYLSNDGMVFSADRKTLWYVPYNGGKITFSTSHYSKLTTIHNISSKYIKYLTIGKDIEKIDYSGINCPNLKDLYVTTKTDNLIKDEFEGYIPPTANIYCYENSGTYKYFNSYDFYKVITEPKKPKTPAIKSIKWGRYDWIDNGNLNVYCVKITFKNVGIDTHKKVYRYNDKTKKYEYLGKVTYGMEYVDKTAEPNKTYKYKVAACDKVNKLYSVNSSKSKAKSITTPKLKKPEKLVIKSTESTRFVCISIDKKVASGYEVYKWNSSKKKYEKITTENRKSVYDADVKVGKTYTYKLRAVAKAATGKTIYGSYTDKIKVKVNG